MLRFCFIFILFFLPLFSQKNNFESAKLSYDQGKYLIAIDLFQNSLKKKNIDKSKVFYNIGNCYTRMAEKYQANTDENEYLVKSILFYEKSLLEKPNNKKSLENLKYVLQKFDLLENYNLPKISSILRVIGFYYYLSFNVQVIVLFAFLFFLIVIFAIVIFLKRLQKFFLISFVIYILLASQFILRARIYKYNLYGLTEKVTTTYQEPNLISKTEISIATIEKLLLLKKKNNFFQIELNGKKLWIREKDVLLIH